MGARQDDLRSPAGNLHTDDIGADPVTLSISLPRDLFLLRQYRVGAPQINDDIAPLEALHDAVDELPFAAFELIVDNLALGIAHTLNNILFGCLSGNAAEHAGIQLTQKLIADFSIRVQALFGLVQGHLNRRIGNILHHRFGFEKLHFANLRIKLRFDFPLMTECLLGSGNHGGFQGGDKDRFINPFFFAYLLDNPVQILLHLRAPIVLVIRFFNH
jgi:hypothetical protein